jgi:hypothetical protein
MAWCHAGLLRSLDFGGFLDDGADYATSRSRLDSLAPLATTLAAVNLDQPLWSAGPES